MKRTIISALAGGVAVSLLAVVAATPRPRALQAPAAARTSVPRVLNGQARSTPAGELERTVHDLAANQEAGWVGYVVEGVRTAASAGDGTYGGAPCGTVFLEGRRVQGGGAEDQDRGEGRAVVVLLRVANGAVQRIRTAPADCDLDAGGLEVHWLTGVDAAGSVALLAGYVKAAGARTGGSTVASPGPSWNSALAAIALHAGPAAASALERFMGGGQPPDIRKRAAFWVGATRGSEGFATLRRYAESDPDDGFRRELPMAISISQDPGGVDVLLRMARNDANTAVRRQAIFWLGQKAGTRVAGSLAEVAASDPETAIKEQAVFALSRMPEGEGIPKLIEVARTNSNPAVRKRAVFWLAQSADPRAIEFLAEILKK